VVRNGSTMETLQVTTRKAELKIKKQRGVAGTLFVGTSMLFWQVDPFIPAFLCWTSYMIYHYNRIPRKSITSVSSSIDTGQFGSRMKEEFSNWKEEWKRQWNIEMNKKGHHFGRHNVG